MIRFRCVNKPASGPCRIGISLTSAPASIDRAGQLFVLGRVDRRQSVGEDADGSPARLDRAAVRGRVDAAGQAGDHRETRPGQGGGQPLGDPGAVGRAVPRADHRDGELIARFEWLLSHKEGRAGRGCSRAAADRAASPRAIRLTSDAPAQAPARRQRRSPGVRRQIFSAILGPTPVTPRVARAMASRTRPADPNRSSSARLICGPTPGTIASWIRSSSR